MDRKDCGHLVWRDDGRVNPRLAQVLDISTSFSWVSSLVDSTEDLHNVSFSGSVKKSRVLKQFNLNINLYFLD